MINGVAKNVGGPNPAIPVLSLPVLSTVEASKDGGITFSVTPHMADRTGVEPVVSSVTGRRVNHYTNGPSYTG